MGFTDSSRTGLPCGVGSVKLCGRVSWCLSSSCYIEFMEGLLLRKSPLSQGSARLGASEMAQQVEEPATKPDDLADPCDPMLHIVP